MDEPTTKDMAEYGEQTLEFFSNLVGGDSPSTEGETCLCDLLADLMHYSRINEIDFDDVLGRARRHFDEECEEEKEAAPSPDEATD